MGVNWKQQGRKATACFLTAALSLTMIFSPTQTVTVQAADVKADGAGLRNPVIEAKEGKVVWDCVYFGGYWQSEYITSQENRPGQGEDDVVHTDTDGTKYLVRENKKCYKYEPIKWRVLSVSEDGTDALLLADKCLEARAYHGEYSETVTWENSDLREWLNTTFMETAFTESEQEAIVKTEIENKRNPYYNGDFEVSTEDGNPTQDYICLLSIDEAIEREYGFVSNYNSSENKFLSTQTRTANSTDFAKSCEEGIFSEGYLLRTLGAIKGYVLSTDNVSEGAIPVSGLLGTQIHDKGHGIRPVLHLDLTKTDSFRYAGQVKQDKTEIPVDAAPDVPSQTPKQESTVTMAPGQIYPKNPVVYEDDLKKNTWDCIYFGKYYNTKIAPSVLSEAGQHDSMQTDENGESYLVRHEQGYFRYEPIKWRVLSINEDGTDAFLMADQVVDIAQYYSDSEVEITWEKSDIRQWLENVFAQRAFTEDEKGKILDSAVETADNRWSGEPGGNDTTDKIYLPSIEEMLNTSYGFSSDEKEGDTRRITSTDYAKAESEADWISSDAGVYWLRSSGSKKGRPAIVGSWGNGVIPMETANKSIEKIGVRPVMHVDLSDTTLWTYAGQVTPRGVVISETEKPDVTVKPPTQTEKPSIQTQQPSKPQVNKPGKPAIKNLKNKKGKKVTITLSKKVSGATGYQLAYATKSSMKGQKTKFFKGTAITVNGLKKKKAYYFRVRAYTKINGENVYGSWGKKKSIKVRK